MSIDFGVPGLPVDFSVPPPLISPPFCITSEMDEPKKNSEENSSNPMRSLPEAARLSALRYNAANNDKFEMQREIEEKMKREWNNFPEPLDLPPGFPGLTFANATFPRKEKCLAPKKAPKKTTYDVDEDKAMVPFTDDQQIGERGLAEVEVALWHSEHDPVKVNALDNYHRPQKGVKDGAHYNVKK